MKKLTVNKNCANVPDESKNSFKIALNLYAQETQQDQTTSISDRGALNDHAINLPTDKPKGFNRANSEQSLNSINGKKVLLEENGE